MGRRINARIQRANEATSDELLAVLPEESPLSMKIVHGGDLTKQEKSACWDLFEKNMYPLYSTSSFGWKPTKRKKEIFHKLSRFILVYDGEELIAFVMFRFEYDEGEYVVYCYDIQIASSHHRMGIGRKLISMLCSFGTAFDMEKVMLTVLKVNESAMVFYKACGFEVDPSAPSIYLDENDPDRINCDYEIMSILLNRPLNKA